MTMNRNTVAARADGSVSLSQAERIRLHKQKMRRRKRRRDRLIVAAIVFFALAVCVVLSLTRFFNISKIEVSGGSHYSQELIIDESGIKSNSNMFRFSAADTAAELQKRLPYIGTARIERTLPNTVRIIISDTYPTLAVDNGTGYTLLDDTLKILETGVSALPEGAALVEGLYIEDPAPGENLAGDKAASSGEGEESTGDAEAVSLLLSVVDEVRKAEFGDVTLYDISDSVNIKLVYQDRLSVWLGSVSGLPQKLRLGKKTIEDEDKVNPHRTGIIDLTRQGIASVRSEHYETLFEDLTEDDTQNTETPSGDG